jgi:hypothetical protein
MSECSPKHPRRKHKERKISAKVWLQEVQIICDFVVQFCYSKKLNIYGKLKMLLKERLPFQFILEDVLSGVYLMKSCSYCYLLDSVSSDCLCQHLCFAKADKYCDCVSAGLNLLPCNDREILSISVCFYVWSVYWPSRTLKTDYKSVCMEHKF